MYKIINIGIPKYLTDLIPKHDIGSNIRNGNKSFFNCRTESFKNSFFPYIIEAWYSLDLTIINSKSLEVFKSKLLAFIRIVQRSIYSVSNSQDLKFLSRLRLGLIHLNEHRYIYITSKTALTHCALAVWKYKILKKKNLHYLHYPTFRMNLMNKVNGINENFSYFTIGDKVSLLLSGDSRFDDHKKKLPYQLQSHIF